MRSSVVILVILIGSGVACSQQSGEKKPTISSRTVGDRCEGCEAIYEYGDKELTWSDTLPDFNDPGPKLEIAGTIYKSDGKSPAANVILYIYHTNQEGIYPKPANAKGWERRHGYIRGWVKTNVDGKYKFLTLRPGAYPGGQNPQHIHATVKEPDKNEYWIDEYLFTDDPILSKEERNNQQTRGGSGIILLTKNADGTWVGKRDIILGMNIPNYNAPK